MPLVAEQARGQALGRMQRQGQFFLGGLGGHALAQQVQKTAQGEKREFRPQAAFVHAGEVQNAVEHVQQHAAGFVDLGEILALAGAQLGLQAEITHADDGVHGRADFVADPAQKILLHAGGLLGYPQGGKRLGPGLQGLFPAGVRRRLRRLELLDAQKQRALHLLQGAEHARQLVAVFQTQGRGVVARGHVLGIAAHQAQGPDHPLVENKHAGRHIDRQQAQADDGQTEHPPQSALPLGHMRQKILIEVGAQLPPGIADFVRNTRQLGVVDPLQGLLGLGVALNGKSAPRVGEQAARPHHGDFGQTAQQLVLLQAELEQASFLFVQIKAVRDLLQRAPPLPFEKRARRAPDIAALGQKKGLPFLQPALIGRADIVQGQTVFVGRAAPQLAEQRVYAVKIVQQAVDFPQVAAEPEKTDPQQEHQAQLHQVGGFDNGPDRHAFTPTHPRGAASAAFLMLLP